MQELLDRLNQWAPWVLIVIGVVCLPLSTVFYQQYLDFNKTFLHSRFCRRWGSRLFGARWTRQVRKRFDTRAVATRGQMWASAIFCGVEIGLGVVWLWWRK